MIRIDARERNCFRRLETSESCLSHTWGLVTWVKNTDLSPAPGLTSWWVQKWDGRWSPIDKRYEEIGHSLVCLKDDVESWVSHACWKLGRACQIEGTANAKAARQERDPRSGKGFRVAEEPWARALWGEVSGVGGNQVTPGHGSHDKSLRFSKVLVFSARE